MSQVQQDPHIVKVYGRLSFPQLFQRKAGRDAQGNPQGKPVFSLVLLLPKKIKNAQGVEIPNPDIAKLTAAAMFTKQEKWQGKPVNLTGKSIRDGEEKAATDGYGPDYVFISARNEKNIGVVDRDLQPLKEEDGKMYAGCWVNVSVRCWAQDNAFGKRLNWSLRNVQFVKHDKPFGETVTPAEQEFAALPDSDEGVDQTAGAGSVSDQI